MSAETIATQLKAQLLRGDIAPGTKLRQTELAEAFGASRIPVRDALALLAAEGLVIARPNRGAEVLQMTPQDIREAYDLRLLLEVDCLNRALPRYSDADYTALDYALTRSEAEATGPDWTAGDALFHETLYAPAGRPRQLAMIRQLRQACQIQIASYQSLPRDRARWLQDHRAMVDQVKSGADKEAVAQLRQHLSAARDRVLSQVARQAGSA